MDALEAIAQRQGVLAFRPDAVEAHTVRAVLEAAAAAPSPVNLQPWAFVVVTDAEERAWVARYLVEVQEARVFGELLGLDVDQRASLMGLYAGFANAPCFVLLCLEPKAAFALPEHADVLRQWHLVALGAAMQSLMVAATALGLGTRWFGGFALDGGGAALKERLAIPTDVEVIAATPLGYHDSPPKARPLQERATLAAFARGDRRALGRVLRGRLPLDELLHRERW